MNVMIILHQNVETTAEHLTLHLCLSSPSVTHLSSCCVRIDGDLAGASSVAVDGGAHVLSRHDGADLLL